MGLQQTDNPSAHAEPTMTETTIRRASGHGCGAEDRQAVARDHSQPENISSTLI